MFNVFENLKIMKKLSSYLFIAITCLTVSANAQLKVDNLGKVGVAAGATAINANFQVGNVTSDFNSTITAVGSDFRIGAYSSTNPFALIQARNCSSNLFTTIGMILNVQDIYGIRRDAITILPSGNVGIGKSNPSYNLDVVGNINASITVKAAGVTLNSDERLKENIKNLSGLTVASLLNLQGVTYRLKPNGAALLTSSLNTESAIQGDTAKSQTIGQLQDTAFFNRNHMGFLAQDLQKVFPELVYADKDGILSIDYIGLIPILVESIKELSNKHVTDSLNFISLQYKLSDLENRISQCCDQTTLKSVQSITNILESPLALPALYQNTPNPFNQNTTIAYYLPVNVKTANLYIYNMQGVQIKIIPINDRANGNIVINGNELIPGMYLYSLIADGKEVDTKRMILTN